MLEIVIDFEFLLKPSRGRKSIVIEGLIKNASIASNWSKDEKYYSKTCECLPKQKSPINK